MRKILLLILCISTASFAQDIVDNINGKWQVDSLIGYPDQSRDEYNIFKIPVNTENDWHYGNQLSFAKDFTFSSHYTAPCGNDCFPSTKGTYELIDANHIKLHLDEVSQNGMCQRFERKPNVDLGVFLVVKTEKGLRLIKTRPDETDAQRQHYSELIHNLPPISTGGPDLNWVELDPLNRDTDNVKILNKGLLADGRFDPKKAKLVFVTSIVEYHIEAFVFKYKKKDVIALYSAGPEIFAIYDK